MLPWFPFELPIPDPELVPYCTRKLVVRSSDRLCVHEKVPYTPVLELDVLGVLPKPLASCEVSSCSRLTLNRSRGHSSTPEIEALVVRYTPGCAGKKLLFTNTGWPVARSTVTPDEFTVVELTAVCRFWP